MFHTSNEANREQLKVGREQGEAFQHAIDAMKEETGHAVQVRAGDYLVAWASEKAEGLYQWRDGQLEWIEPGEEDVHLEVAVADAADGRFVPGLEVTVTLIDGDRTIGTHAHPMLWHPWLFHYGRNWTVPGPGPYDVRVRIEPLRLARHDKHNGRRFAQPVEVHFTDVRFETGQKRS